MYTRQKLVQACKGLGLNLLEIAQFVQISEYPAIACWGYDVDEKRNYIYINPRALRLSIEHIRLVLKHEILHYAGYKNLEHARDFNKANIAFDIVINKILTLAYERDMKSLCRKIYPSETKHNILALARPDIFPDDLRQHKKLWQNIWNNGEIPSPASVYYRISLPQCIDNNPFSTKSTIHARIVFRQIQDSQRDDRLGQLCTQVVNKITKRLQEGGFSNTKFSAAFKEIFVRKKSFDSTSVEEFISRLESRQKLEETYARIITALDSKSSCQLYPYQLSRIGIVYAACGISDKVPIFWNKTPESRKNKIAVYIDTSPSMECYQEKEVFLIDKLRGYFPTTVYCFGHDIKEISLGEFAKGNYDAGYSTSFDAVIEHVLNSQFDAGIVFTDGFSYINSRNEVRFKQNRKRLFTVYFSNNGDVTSDLDKLSEQTMTVATD